MGVLRAPGRARWAGKAGAFGHHRVRAHDSTALTRGSKTQGSCLSHTCGVSVVCRQHCNCIPTGQALTEVGSARDLGMLGTGQMVTGSEHCTGSFCEWLRKARAPTAPAWRMWVFI